MEQTIFEKYKFKLIASCDFVNYYADEKDIGRNHVNYGCAITCASIIREFGHKIDIPVYSDGDYLRIGELTID